MKPLSLPQQTSEAVILTLISQMKKLRHKGERQSAQVTQPGPQAPAIYLFHRHDKENIYLRNFTI